MKMTRDERWVQTRELNEGKMAAKKLTKKRIDADIGKQCSEACEGAELPMMGLGKIREAACVAYNSNIHIGHDERLKLARAAADAKVAELRVDKPRTDGRNPLDNMT